MTATKSRRERTLWRVGKGVLQPFDAATTEALRAKGYKVGDVLHADLAKPRSPGFHRLAHQLGGMLAENLDTFDGMPAHAVLKRLQWEGNIGCEEFGAQAPGLGLVMVRIPRSLSFQSMDDGEFREVMTALCRYVSKTYWPTCTPEQVEAMASVWVEAV